jgi:predicted nucleic acid-binding protein
VVDANLGAGAVLSIRGLESAPALFNSWESEQRSLFVPEWWWAEVASVISQHVFQKLISLEDAHLTLDKVKLLEVTTMPTSYELLHDALTWANTIRQSKVYDSIYLALAENLNAEFWTADQRLANSARALNIDWVKWLGDWN